MQVILGRRLIGTVLTVYFPTIIMVIISHTTNYFKPFFFEADVAVNLTVMLVRFCCGPKWSRTGCPFLLNTESEGQDSQG